MIEIGQKITDFSLPGTNGEAVSLSEVLAEHQAVVLVFYLFDFSGG